MTDTNNGKIEPNIQHIYENIAQDFIFSKKNHIQDVQYLLYVENVKGKLIIRAGINDANGVKYEGILNNGEHARLEITPENGLIFTTGELDNTSEEL